VTTLDTMPTPALLVDGPILVQNIRQMAERAQARGVELWPHVKAHKTTQIAQVQREHGATGFTAATLREAECFATAGFERLLLAYPPAGEWRLERIRRLAETVDLRVVVDSTEAAATLDDAQGYLWEVDCGVGRTGTAPGEATADLIAAAEGSFQGLLTFGGHAYAAADPSGIVAAAQDEVDAHASTMDALARHGIEASARSAGSTPTVTALAEPGPITEIRPGNYVFNDATQVVLGVADEQECALSVLATVVSKPQESRVILDCGSKALAAERLTPRTTTFGFVHSHPELSVDRLYEEHAIVTTTEPTTLSVGDRVRVVPNHACATTNLHELMHVLEDGEVADVWNVDARGWS
jgi:D-serine deaminase-like pyridoxal phosphate-dependent protein